MATVARLESSLGFNDTEFTAGIARAERRAQTFGSRMEHTLERAFRRDPARRAERALTGSLASLAQGDIPGAIGSITGKMAGMGVIAGVGIGLAVEGFSKLHQHVTETEKASADLYESMRRPLRFVIESGQAESYIATLDKQAEALREKYQSTTQQVLDSFKYGPISTQRETEETTGRQTEINDADERARRAAKMAGEFALRRAQLAQNEDPRQRATAEGFAKFDQQAAAVRSKPADKGTRDQLEAIQIQRDAFQKSTREQAQAKVEEYQATVRLASINASSLDVDQKKLAIAKERIRIINAELGRVGQSTDQAMQLKGQRADVAADAGNVAFLRAKSEIKETPEEHRTKLTEQFTDKYLRDAFNKTGKITGYDQDLSKRMGSYDADIAMRSWNPATSGSTPEKDVSPQMLTELQNLNKNFDKYWGAN